MIANNKFKSLPKSFWADVRAISQENGYTVRGKGTIKVPTIEEIISVYKKLSLNTDNIILNGTPTQHSVDLIEYFRYRADILYSDVRPKLMNANQAQMYYEDLVKKHNPKCLIPENKQSGDKKKIAYLTAIVNILIEANIANLPCDYDPRKLATITKDGRPIRTLARRVDGALLDGMELEELHEHEKIKVLHYLIIDAYNTWWNDGKSYLCRMIDMLNMGYVDEILFGYEVIERLPIIVKEWVALLKYR
jgi:hypothetical protein